MDEADKLLEKIEKELETAKKKGEVSERIIKLVGELCNHQSELVIQNEKLKESEEKFRVISEAAPVSIAIYRDDKFVYVNPYEESILEYTKEELLKMNFIGLVHPDYKEMVENKVKARMQGNSEPDNYEVKIISKSGKEKWMELSTDLIQYNSLPAGIIISVDITERKKAEKELKQTRDNLEAQVKEGTEELETAFESLKGSELKFKTLTENSPDIINRVDKEFKNVYINPEITNISNRPPEYFIGKKMDELGIPEEFTVPLIEKVKKVFETGTMGEFVTEIPTIKGLKTFYTYVAPEYDENGKINTVLSISRDVTELKQAEYQLKETLNELKRSNEELQQFAYVSSHDLQEPLRTIASFTQLLERRYHGKLDSDADEFMDYIVEAAKRMKAQIEGLLEYSRVGTKGKEFEPVNMNLVLNQTIQNLNLTIRETDTEIIHKELPTVIGDEQQLQRVFQNLILNAIRFRKCEEPLKIHISAYKSEDGKEYIFSVQDNGIGIEKQYFDRIFTIFQQLHTRDEYGGTGIGLSVVKRITDRHGGRVWVESELGEGSTFYFTLPIEPVTNGGHS